MSKNKITAGYLRQFHKAGKITMEDAYIIVLTV